MSTFAACSNSGENPPDTRSAKEIYDAMVEKIGADKFPAMLAFDENTLEDFYGLTESDYDDFYGQMPLMNVTATEILVVKVKDGKQDAVKAGIEKRQEAMLNNWATYLPAQEALVKDYKRINYGSWEIFIVANESADIEKAFIEILENK
jgi:hypothetical protein